MTNKHQPASAPVPPVSILWTAVIQDCYWVTGRGLVLGTRTLKIAKSYRTRCIISTKYGGWIESRVEGVERYCISGWNHFEGSPGLLIKNVVLGTRETSYLHPVESPIKTESSRGVSSEYAVKDMFERGCVVMGFEGEFWKQPIIYGDG